MRLATDRFARHLFTVMLAAGLALSTPGMASEGQMFKELLEMSLKEKKGLTFYVHGQTISGGVTRIIGDDAVEIKSREFGRIIIQLDRVDAVAAN
jgi:hypothetical protein